MKFAKFVPGEEEVTSLVERAKDVVRQTQMSSEPDEDVIGGGCQGAARGPIGAEHEAGDEPDDSSAEVVEGSTDRGEEAAGERKEADA